MKRKNKLYKKCPRCGNRCLVNQTECEECGLLFSRLEFASNKMAKKKLIHFDYDYVIYTKDLPKDVTRWKLILLTIFTGIFGGHYYYVGKYIKGLLMTASFVYLLFCTIFNAQLAEFLETYYLYFPIGVSAFAWMLSLVFVVSNKFKVPITVDMSAWADREIKQKLEDLKKTGKELKKENFARVDENSQTKSAQKDTVQNLKKDSFEIIEKVLGIKKK